MKRVAIGALVLGLVATMFVVAGQLKADGGEEVRAKVEALKKEALELREAGKMDAAREKWMAAERLVGELRDKPRDGDAPREREGDKPRDGDRDVPREGDRPRDGDQPRERDVPRDGDRPKEGPRDGDVRREGDAPRETDRVSPEAVWQEIKELRARAEEIEKAAHAAREAGNEGQFAEAREKMARIMPELKRRQQLLERLNAARREGDRPVAREGSQYTPGPKNAYTPGGPKAYTPGPEMIERRLRDLELVREKLMGQLREADEAEKHDLAESIEKKIRPINGQIEELRHAMERIRAGREGEARERELAERREMEARERAIHEREMAERREAEMREREERGDRMAEMMERIGDIVNDLRHEVAELREEVGDLREQVEDMREGEEEEAEDADWGEHEEEAEEHEWHEDEGEEEEHEEWEGHDHDEELEGHEHDGEEEEHEHEHEEGDED